MRETFAQHRHPELTRTCAFCGRDGTTQFEHCPHCGQSYFERPPRLSRTARRVLLGLAGVAFVAFAVWLTPQLIDFRHHSDARARASHAKLVAEPAASIGIGALLAGAMKVEPDEKVCVVLTGGNWDLCDLAEIYMGRP